MKAVPAHKQTDKSKAPGQTHYGFDRHPYLKHNNSDPASDKGDRTLSDYIKRINERK